MGQQKSIKYCFEKSSATSASTAGIMNSRQTKIRRKTKRFVSRTYLAKMPCGWRFFFFFFKCLKMRNVKCRDSSILFILFLAHFGVFFELTTETIPLKC